MTAGFELHLSRLTLDPRHPEAQRCVADCARLHRVIMAAFPDMGDAQARAVMGVLYRPELHAATGVVTVLVQSEMRPDWRLMSDRVHAGRSFLAADRPPVMKSIGEALDAIADGDHLRFRLRANPTKRLPALREGDPPNALAGKRVALLREPERLAWMEGQAARAGCRAADVVVQVDALTGAEQHGWSARDGDKRARLTFGAVVFDGTLEVQDRTRLLAAIRAGLGSGKAYGFGLLSVARGS
jgi:CRISPR system Cascade subunit CasE